MAFIQKVEGKKGAIYKVHYTDRATGKRRCKSHSRYKDAVAFKDSPKLTGKSEAARLTVAEAADHWYTTCKATGRKGREPVSRATRRQYRRLADHIKDARIACDGDTMDFGDILLSRLSRGQCEAYRDHLVECFSRNYARKHLTALKSILDQARWDDLMDHDPSAQVFIRAPARDAGVRIDRDDAIPDLPDIRHLLHTMRTRIKVPDRVLRRRRRRYKLVFEAIAFGGLRPGEVLGLPWRDVDFGKGGLWISQDIEEDGTVGRLKSKSAHRFVPMPSHYMNQLRRWRHLCPASRLDLVFPNWSGNAEFLSNMNRRGWRPLLKDAGLVDAEDRHIYPPKSLRHARASLEIESGANPKEIQRLMGHSSIRVTYDVYGHLFEDHGDRRAERADAVAGVLLQGNPLELVTRL